MSNEILEIDDLVYHRSTDAAFCVSTEEDTFGNEAERIFLPKSKVEKQGDTFLVPEWLAIEKELV